MALALTICEVCPPQEVGIMINVLLNVFDTRESLIKFMKIMIDRDLAAIGESFPLIVFLLLISWGRH